MAFDAPRAYPPRPCSPVRSQSWPRRIEELEHPAGAEREGGPGAPDPTRGTLAPDAAPQGRAADEHRSGQGQEQDRDRDDP
ncbi:MAG: hypothetical protein QOE38_2399, partial [Thermoleophilaceae bacterium]|nr:hypothetical protein [Thermoleophilaceae bacterium]